MLLLIFAKIFIRGTSQSILRKGKETPKDYQSVANFRDPEACVGG